MLELVSVLFLAPFIICEFDFMELYSRSLFCWIRYVFSTDDSDLYATLVSTAIIYSQKINNMLKLVLWSPYNIISTFVFFVFGQLALPEAA